jgi:hypothetical protein
MSISSWALCLGRGHDQNWSIICFTYLPSCSENISRFRTVSDKDQVRRAHFRDHDRVFPSQNMVKAIEAKIAKTLRKFAANDYILFDNQYMAHQKSWRVN